MSDSVSCNECGSVVPADAPDGICPACLWQVAALDVAECDRGIAAAASTAAIASTVQSAGDLEATASVAVAAPSRRRGGGARSADAPAVIRTLGNYDLLEELGRGGMGVVYKAVQRRADRLVAVKLILGGAASDEESRERFESEVQTLARLRHPNIVPVFEVGDEEGCPYFSMEYMSGGSLAEKAKRAPLAAAEAAGIVEQLAAAVEAAHAVGVLHRDIKPGNVLLDQDGIPKLTDFGLAKRLDRDEGLTHTGSVLGTPGYMPPEQARGDRDLTPAADVYSLGATLFALLAGRPPFAGQSFHDTLQKVIAADPPRLRQLRPEIARELEAVCLKCLEKEPAGRYASAKALAEDLARWQSGASTIARPQTLPQRAWRQLRRHWRVALVTGALLAFTAAAAAVARVRDPLVQIDAAQRSGKAITLIGPSGGARWHRWEFGAGTVRDEQTFEVFSVGTGFVELVPRVRHRRFRLVAEFFADDSTHPDSWAGVYIGRVRVKAGGDSLQRVLAAQFHDNRIDRRPAFDGKGDPLSVQDYFGLSTTDAPSQQTGTPVGVVRVPETEEMKQAVNRPWRRLIVEVDDVGIRARIHPDVRGPPLVAQPDPIPLAGLRHQTVNFDPGGGCGLYVRNARVWFRNVVLEPLP